MMCFLKVLGLQNKMFYFIIRKKKKKKSKWKNFLVSDSFTTKICSFHEPAPYTIVGDDETGLYYELALIQKKMERRKNERKKKKQNDINVFLKKTLLHL